MAKDYKAPEEFDLSPLTEASISEAINAAKEKWNDLGNGLKVKAKITDKMDEKLSSLVADSKTGNWKRHLEEAIVQMITYNYDTKSSLLWYGHFISSCELKRDIAMPSPAGVRFMFNKYEMFINPLLFGLYTTEQQIAILKHEVLHIINLHIVRQKDREHKKWNYSTDISINQQIPNIPPDALQPETFKLSKNLNAEQYYDSLPIDYEGGKGSSKEGSGESETKTGSSGEGEEGQGSDNTDNVVDSEKKLKDLILSALNAVNQGLVGDHSKWQESEGDAEAAKEIARQMSETSTNKSRGSMPTECSDAIAMLKMKEQINWKKELRRIVGNRKAYSKLTIKKNDRRFPDRKDLRGKTRDHVADILVILDVSGSMSDEEILYGLNETRAIAEKAGAGVKIIQIDTTPKLVENFDPKAKNFVRRGFGGTLMYPAIEFAAKNNVRFDAIVLITDGYVEQSFDGQIPRVPFIWLVTQDVKNLAFDITPYKKMKAHTLKIEKKK
jgi:predicted metal-dependent peptidase